MRFGSVLLLSFAVWICGVAQADERVRFEKGDFKETEWEAIKRYFFSEDPTTPRMMAAEYGLPADEAMEKFRRERLYVGRFDLNLDEVPELFVFIGHSSECGTAGCATHIFEKSGQEWIYLTTKSVHDKLHEGPQLFIADEQRWWSYRPGTPDYIRLKKLDKSSE